MTSKSEKVTPRLLKGSTKFGDCSKHVISCIVAVSRLLGKIKTDLQLLRFALTK